MSISFVWFSIWNWPWNRSNGGRYNIILMLNFKATLYILFKLINWTRHFEESDDIERKWMIFLWNNYFPVLVFSGSFPSIFSSLFRIIQPLDYFEKSNSMIFGILICQFFFFAYILIMSSTTDVEGLSFLIACWWFWHPLSNHIMWTPLCICHVKAMLNDVRLQS